MEITHSSYGDHLVLSTADVAFVAAGAFSGFHQIVRNRAAVDRIGFGREQAALHQGAGIAVSFTAGEVENLANLQTFGFLPELLARFGRFVPFEALDASTLMDILRTNVVDKLVREFEDEGFALAVDDEVLGHLVAEGLKRETGARGLVSILTRHLEDAAFDSFAEVPGGRVHLTLDSGQIRVHLEPSAS
jgi:ATP-dependent Clp protease ATP-binding subunit ClpX